MTFALNREILGDPNLPYSNEKKIYNDIRTCKSQDISEHGVL